MKREIESLNAPFEPHYSVQQLSNFWNLSEESVRKLVMHEPGTIKLRLGKKRAHTRYSVPESVARRIHTKLANPSADDWRKA